MDFGDVESRTVPAADGTHCFLRLCLDRAGRCLTEHLLVILTERVCHRR